MQYEIENKADLCPVCQGRGKYTEYLNYGTTASTKIEKTCHRLWWKRLGSDTYCKHNYNTRLGK